MNRKLRKTLKEIYASEKPSEYPDFLKEIKKERNKKLFRFTAPAMALFLTAFFGLYGYCELLEARNHSIEPQEKTLSQEEMPEHIKEETQQKQPTAFSPAESITTQRETVSETSTSEPALSAELSTTQTTGFTTAHTTIRMETTVPETAVTQIHLPNQTVPETIREILAEETDTFPPETTIPPTPEVPAESTAIPEAETATEKIQESEWRCLDLSRVSDVEALQASYWELRRQEAMNWSMNSLLYEDSGRQANEMLSELEALHRENENPYYERYHSILVNGIAPDSHARAYTELKDTFMNELLTDLENTISPDVFQEIQASQQDFQEKYDMFWEGDLQLSYGMGSMYTSYLEMELIQYRVLLLMNYFY